MKKIVIGTQNLLRWLKGKSFGGWDWTRGGGGRGLSWDRKSGEEH
jgi:hypothetical protein